jgi:integrase
MTGQGGRRLRDGRVVAVHKNAGLRKICRCPRRVWAKCRHGWHFNWRWGGVDYRFSLDRQEGRHIDGKAEAEDVADRIRREVKDGSFGKSPAPASAAREPEPTLTFSEFAETWKKGRGFQLANARDNAYRLGTICRFMLPGTTPPTTLGDTPVQAISVMDIEAFREARKAAKLSSVAINHDLRLLRKMFNWGIRKGLVERTPFKIGTEPAISLEREIPRNRRFEGDDDEERLLAAANGHLRAVITAILDTACRPGEILSLQWADVSLARREITIRAEKEKTRRERIVPISQRLMALLEMRKLDPSGQPWQPAAYVFGNAVGERVKSIRTAWVNASEKAELKGLQLRDLRHEAASRFEEAGMPIIYVSNMLGHSNLSTTSRYLNIRRRGLHLAMRQFDESRRVASSLQDQSAPQAEPASEPDQPASQNHLIS